MDVIVVPENAGADGVRRVSVDRLMDEARHPRTRVVTVSHVEYASGQRLDIRAIGQFCRQRGILFCVDAIQSLGVLPGESSGIVSFVSRNMTSREVTNALSRRLITVSVRVSRHGASVSSFL